jgi:hypothetical protein
VQVSTKLNRAHLVTGEQALILPASAARKLTGRRRASSSSARRIRWASCNPRAETCRPPPRNC